MNSIERYFNILFIQKSVSRATTTKEKLNERNTTFFALADMETPTDHAIIVFIFIMPKLSG